MRIFQLTLLTLAALSHSTTANAYRWEGKSNTAGGVVSYTERYKSIEHHESSSLEFRCDGYDKRITLSIMSQFNSANMSSKEILFEIDGKQFYEYSRDSDDGGMFGSTPIFYFKGRERLINALMSGSRFSIFELVNGNEARIFRGHLKNSRTILERNLAPCF